MSRFAFLRVDSDSDSSLGRSAARPEPPATGIAPAQPVYGVATEAKVSPNEVTQVDTLHATAPDERPNERSEQTANDDTASDDGGLQLAQIAAAMTAITSPTHQTSGATSRGRTQTNLQSSTTVQDDILQSDSKTGASATNMEQGTRTGTTGPPSVSASQQLISKAVTPSSPHVVVATGDGDNDDDGADDTHSLNCVSSQNRVSLPSELLQHHGPSSTLSSSRSRLPVSSDEMQRRDVTRDGTPLSLPAPKPALPNLIVPILASDAIASQPPSSQGRTADTIVAEPPSSRPREEWRRRVSPTHIVARETDLDTTPATPQQSHVLLPAATPTTPSLQALSEATPRRPRKATAGCGFFSFCRRPRRAGQGSVLFTARSAESAVARQMVTAGRPDGDIAGAAATEDIRVLATPEAPFDVTTDTAHAAAVAAPAPPPPVAPRDDEAGEPVMSDVELPLATPQEVSTTSAPPPQALAEPELEQRIAALEQALTLASEVVTVTTDTSPVPPPQPARRHRRRHRHHRDVAPHDAVTVGLSPFPSNPHRPTHCYTHHARRRRPVPARPGPTYTTMATTETTSATFAAEPGQSAPLSPQEEERRPALEQAPTMTGLMPTSDASSLPVAPPAPNAFGGAGGDGGNKGAVGGQVSAVAAFLAPATTDATRSRPTTVHGGGSQDDVAKGRQQTNTTLNGSRQSRGEEADVGGVPAEEVAAPRPDFAPATCDTELAVRGVGKTAWPSSAVPAELPERRSSSSSSPYNSQNTPERAGLTEAVEELDQGEVSTTYDAIAMELLSHRATSHDEPPSRRRSRAWAGRMPAYQHRLLLDLRAREQRELDGLARSWRELTFHPQIHDIGGGGDGARMRWRGAAEQHRTASRTSQTSIATTRSIGSGRHPFAPTPRGSLTTTRLRRSNSVFSRLYRDRREATGRSPAFAETPYSFTPQISPHARQRETRATVADVVARLYPQPPRKDAATLNNTTAVTPPPRDRAHGSGGDGGKSVFDRLYEQRPQAVPLSTPAERRQEEAAVCTFQPRITDMARRLSVHSPKNAVQVARARDDDNGATATNASTSLTIRTEERTSGMAEAQSLSSAQSSGAVQLAEESAAAVVSVRTDGA